MSFEAYYPPPLDGWYEVRAWPSPEGLAVYFVDISDRREAQDALARSAERLALLASVSDGLTSTLDPVEGVSRLSTLLVPGARRLVPGDARRRPPRRGLAPRAPRRRTGRTPTPRCSETLRQYSSLRLRAMTDSSYLARTIREMTTVADGAGATDQGGRRAPRGRRAATACASWTRSPPSRSRCGRADGRWAW